MGCIIYLTNMHDIVGFANAYSTITELIYDFFFWPGIFIGIFQRLMVIAAVEDDRVKYNVNGVHD